MAELNVQQKNIVNQLRQAYPELKSYSDEQILSLYNQQLNNIQLSEDERISIMNGRNGVVNDGMGIQLETSQKAVSKEQESQLKSALTARLNAVSTNVKKAEDSNGFLGKAWSWTKNTFNFGDSSDKVREQQKADLKALESGNIAEAFKKITGLDYTVENVNKFLNNEVQTKSETALNGYTEGQEMASDITADIISGIAAVGIYTAAVAAAPFTGGASIAVGVAAAGASAAAIKTGIKYADAKSGGREYTADNLKKDLATGAFSGVLAPITGGMGGAVGKTVATKVGIQAVKQVGKEVAEEAVEQTAKGFVKTMLTNPTGYEYIGGNMFKRGLAFAAEAATDGAIGGAVDNAFRTAYDGGSLEDIGNSAVEGFVGGAIMSPVIGGGMKVAGKGAQKIFGKNNVDIDANGNRVRVNDDGTVVRIDENGNEIPASATDAEIHIPKGVLASDIAPFIETDDGFRNIVKKRADDIAELDKIKDVDEFLEKSFSMIKEEMGLADSPIKFEITNGDNQYDLETNTVSINPNWANGDKAELFGAIAHELDHFLQWKAVMRNVDENHPMYKAVYDQLTLTKVGYDNLSYILFKNEAPATELLKKQAKEYADNWQNYIEPADPKTGKVDVTSEQYKRYKEQPVEAEAMRRGEIVVEEYRRAVNGNNSPSGIISIEEVLAQRTLSQNPAEVVADKVYREWTTADVNTRVPDEPVDLFNLDPYAGLKQSAPEVNGEVTSLIFTGKLKQKLTQHYVDLENTFKDIAKRRSADIRALADACGNDREKFANGIVEMLCEDFGMKGFAPQVKFIDINRGTVIGQANYYDGLIHIDHQVRNADELVEILSHELTHMMQFKDILVQYGEKGIREIVKNAPDNLKERDFNAILNNPYTQKILQNIESFKQDDVGSLNEFIKRIYKEELATGVDSQKNPEIYFNQLLEREAYHLASEQIGKGVHSVDDVYFDEFNFAWDPVTGQFNMPSGVLPTSNNYLQRIQRVHFSTNGGLKTSEVKVYESFRRAMHKVLIATNGNAELPDNIHFREIPDHINGIACKDAATQSISINRCFLDNLDSSISKYIKGLQDVEMLKVDADGKIHIPDFLRNDLTIEFEKKLNAYNESLSLADKLELYTQMGYFINLQNQARTNPIVTIEKIMVTGDNQAVLKKRGLFKSRDEVASMTAKKQVAYLKEIALITKIPEDAVLIRDVDQIFTHELGHLNHKLTPADEAYLTSKAVIDEHRNNVAIQNTCSKVTQYAKESPKEFVAEVYSGLINGQKFDDDVMALYRKYKGPEVENSTRANLPAGVVMSDEVRGSSLGAEKVKNSSCLNLDELRTQKNQWGSSRFEESDLAEISNYMAQDADLTRFMLECKNSSGDFEYSSYDIKNAFALKEKYPEITNVVRIGNRIPSYKWEDFCKIMQEDRDFAMKLLNLKDGNDEFILTSHDCLETFSIAKNDQENALRLLSTLDKDGTPRVSSYHLKELLDMNKSNPKLFSIIFNRKDTSGNYSFFPYNITTLQDAFNEIPEMLEKFLTMTDKTGKFRFGEFEIEDLCKVPQEKRKQLLEFLEMENLDGEYRFEHSSSAIELLQYEDKEQFINELINMKNSRGRERFSINEIETILEFTTDKNILRIKELIGAKTDEGYEYSAWNIKHLIELEEKAPELVSELRSMRDSLGNVRFSMAATENIVEYYEKIPYIKTLISEKLDDGNYRFGNELSSFINNMSIFGERKIKMLAELKDSKGNYRLDGKEIEHIIKSGNPLKQVLEILKIENSDGTSRYNAYDACELSTVIKGFEDEPEELIVKQLMEMNAPDGHKRFDGSTVWKLVSDYSKWEDIINQKLPNGEYKYTADMIAEMVIKGKELQPVLDNIIAKCLELDSPYGKILTDPVTGQYIVESANNNFVYFDKDGNFIKKYIKEGERTSEKTANGVEEVLTSSNHYRLRTSWEKLDDNFTQLTESIRVEYDPEGNVLYKERYIQAPDVDGKYEIWRKDANGHKYKIGIAEKTPNGTIIIEKALTSKDGIRTQYVYIEDISGQRISQTRIIDKNGNIILDNKQKFKQIDENHFTSTENGVKYDIQYFEDRVVVTKNNSESVEISIGNNGSNTEGILSKELLPILKQMPGSIYFKIKKYGLKKIGKEIDFVDEQNAHYSLNKNLISLSNELSTKDEIFVLMHELGHYIDYSEGIHTNKELLKIYERERKALFDSSTPSEINALDYFVQINHINNGGAITELIAEVNALLHTSNNASRLELRGQYLQQYFPETFAFIARALNKAE